MHFRISTDNTLAEKRNGPFTDMTGFRDATETEYDAAVAAILAAIVPEE